MLTNPPAPLTLVTVEVTQDDIDRGIPDNPCACPVALAMRRVLSRRVDVELGRCWITDTGKHFDLPEVVNEFVSDFDDHSPVSPFTFTVSVPSPAAGGTQS